MSALDLPPGIGLVGTPLGMFRAPLARAGSRRCRSRSSSRCGAITWCFVSRHPYRWHASTQFVLPLAFAAFALLGFAVRRARIAITRDGVRWGWDDAQLHAGGGADRHRTRLSRWRRARGEARLVVVSRRARLGSLRRAGSPAARAPSCRSSRCTTRHSAPLRARLQSYGRFLDGLLVGCAIAALRGHAVGRVIAAYSSPPVKSRLPPRSASLDRDSTERLTDRRAVAESIGERDDLALDVIDLGRSPRLEVIPHRRSRMRIDRDDRAARAA